VLGDGKRSTRNMKSTTAIPAHSTSGRAGREPAERGDVPSFSFTCQPYCVMYGAGICGRRLVGSPRRAEHSGVGRGLG
jgi:hypothetical protein